MWYATVHWQDGVCDGYGKWPMDAVQQAWDHMAEVLGERFKELGDLARVELKALEGDS